MSRAFRLGLFIITTLLIFWAGIFLIGSKEFLFSSTYRLNADFSNVAGLNGGAEVRVGGIHEGTVRQIQLPMRPGDKVRVLMDLAPATRNVVKEDSLASIKSEGLVGDKFVEVSFGSEQSPKVNNGDTIQSESPIEISDLIKKTDLILDSTKQAMGNIDDTASNLNAISSKINQGNGTIGALINDKEVYRNVNAGANAFQEDMEALKHNILLRGFFNKRGYEDAAELKEHEISQLPPTPIAKEFDYDTKKIFDKPATAKLKDDKALNEAGSYLQGNPFGLAVVASYTDGKGDTERDHTLTAARAMVVRDYLVQNFKLDDTRIKIIGLGKSAQANNGGKVEILIYPAGSNAAQPRNPMPRHK